jgi:hypothetical protein
MIAIVEGFSSVVFVAAAAGYPRGAVPAASSFHVGIGTYHNNDGPWGASESISLFGMYLLYLPKYYLS